MSELHEIIAGFNTTERQKFEHYLDKKNKRQDVRNIALFKSTLKGTEDKIKAEIGENAFHVLNKRLKDNALDFIALQALENDTDHETIIIKELLTAKRLLSDEKYKLGLKILSRIEERCKKVNANNLLLEAYRIHITYGFLLSENELNSLFNSYMKTNEKANHSAKMNLVYAEVRYAFISLDKNSTDFKIGELITQAFDKYGIDPDYGYTFKSLFKIAEIVDLSGVHYKNYHSVNLFFADKLAELKGGPKDTVAELPYHIKLIYLTANVFFRKREFMISLFYLDEMERQLERTNIKNKANLFGDLNILKALNNNYLNKHDVAFNILESNLNDINSSKFTMYHKLTLTLALVSFQQSKFKRVYRTVQNLNKSDSYYEKHLGLEWVINKKILEIICSIERNEVVELESKIISLRRKYGEHFKAKGEHQFISFLGLVKSFGENKKIIESDSFKSKIKNSMRWKVKHEEDIFLESFYAWFKAKLDNTDLYSTTLSLIKG